MSKQTEALRLIREHEMHGHLFREEQVQCVAELRRLHERNAQLLEALKYAANHCTWPSRYGTQSERQLEALDLIEKAEGMQ